MTFFMPKIHLEKISYSVASQLSELTDQNWVLLPCPKYNTHDWLKFFHSIILRELYHDTRWTVPVWHTWNMPHTLNPGFKEAQMILTPVVQQMIQRGVFL